MRPPSRTSWFTHFAKAAAYATGRPVTFMAAVVIILLWALTGRFFHYSDTWQLVINTSTTIVTFLMVFLIQNTQNRDAETLQIKLDELIRAISQAHNALLDLEELDDDQIHYLRSEYEDLARKAREEMRQARAGLKRAQQEPGETVQQGEKGRDEAQSDPDIPDLPGDDGGA